MPISSPVLLADFPPQWMSDVSFLNVTLWQWIVLGIILVGGVIVGTILQWIVLAIGMQIAQRTETTWDEKIFGQLPGPTRILFSLLLIRLFLPLAHLNPGAQDNIELILQTLLIITATWLTLRMVGVGAEIAEAVLTRDVEDENLIRSMHTWVAIPRRIVRFVLVVMAVALVCLQFEVVRSVGVSLLASAGLAGIIIGLAAQKALTNVLAGIQLVFSQPMKIGDVVIVEGEYGNIEEINLTHVVVKIWDQRRLILPVGYFLEKPFENWTHQSKELMGTVYFFTDYTIPIEEIRSELQRVLKESDLWDERVGGVLVTDLTRDTVQVRLLVSAKDPGTVWDLRCHVREKMLEWLQSKGVAHLPRHRVEMDPDTK